MRRRTATSVPSACGLRIFSASARSCGMATAVKAAPEHSGASGPRPSARVAPVKRIWSSDGVQIHRAVSAAASASMAVVASQARLLERVFKRLKGPDRTAGISRRARPRH
ncbi:MAG: hypothetical protein FD125_1552 [bacterium]|nr:MAG: hypothetical protein FD125_1552 [bacterium]